MTGLAAKGINQKSLMAAINYYEFKYREGDFGRYPAGLMYGLQMMDSWLYDETKPFIHIRASDTFEKLKENVGKGYFEQLIQTWLLDNNHRSLLILAPEKGLTEKTEAETEEKLAAYKAGLSKAALEAMVGQTKDLKRYQEEPSAAEDLAKIPILEIEDIEPKPQPFYNQYKEVQGCPVLCHDVESRGIAYVKWVFDTGSVPFEKIPYIGLLSSVLGNVDTERHNYTELADEINIHTGGIRANTNIYTEQGSTDILYPKMEVVMKVLVPKFSDGIRLMAEIMSESKLSDTKRLKEIIGQLKSRLEMMMNGNGHMVAVNRATGFISLAGMYREYEEGLAYYRFIEELDRHFDERKEEIVGALKETAALIFRKENLLMDITCSEVSFEALAGEMAALLRPILGEMSERVSESDSRVSGAEVTDLNRKAGILPEVESALRQLMEGVGAMIRKPIQLREWYNMMPVPVIFPKRAMPTTAL